MKKVIITIGRQTASGGRHIGESVAKRLNIAYYDKNILKIAAKESGICRELFEQNDEKPNKSLIFSMISNLRAGELGNMYMDLPLNHKLFLAQFDTIKKIAEKESCVIVGRCADYVLRDDPNTLKVFVYSDLQSRIDRAVVRYMLEEKQAKDSILKSDKERQSYYSYFTGQEWGNMENYDLMLNTDKLGMENAINAIVDIAEIFRKE